jgi:hypothetical protein
MSDLALIKIYFLKIFVTTQVFSKTQLKNVPFLV